MPLVIDPWDSRTLALSALAIAAGTRQRPNLAAALDDSLLEDRRPLLAGSLETTPSASNRCRRPAPCQAYIEVYEPQPAASNPPALALQVRIVDRGTREQKFDSGPFSIAPYMRPGNPVTPVPLTLPVAGLPAGSYLVEIRARDSSGAVSAVRTTELEVD